MEIKKYYQTVIFDWDGCLVNSLPLWFNGMKKAVLEFNIHVPDELIKRGFQSWQIFIDLGVNDMKKFTNIVYGYVASNLNSLCFNEGVVHLLIELKKKNKTCCIITSSEKEKVLPVLNRLNAGQYFSYIVGRNDVVHLKPHPESIEKTLRRVKGNKEHTLIIGDSQVDIDAGKNAGISTAWFSSEINQSFHPYLIAKNIKPDYRITTMKDLWNILIYTQQ